MPTATDLVTDLPADFEVFGQAVATSMADLLGGTTGQILSKNSNTDMDFVWTSPNPGDITGITATSPLTGGGTSGDVTVGIQAASTSQSGAVQLTDSTSSTSTTTAATPNAVKTSYDLAAAAIPKSTVTTNGDLIYGTGSGTVSRIGVGSSGQVLTVSGGVPAWATASSGSTNVAGKNALINSNFSIWQRGTSIAGTGGSGVYSADRWSIYNSNYTVSRQTTSDTTNLPFIDYCARVQRNNGSTATSGANLVQPLESINSRPFIGKTATLSFYARAGANYSPTSSALGVYLLGGTGTDQNPNNTYTGQTTPISQTATLTTTWQRFSYTTGSTLATTINELAVQFTMIGTGTAGANDYFEVTGVQLEIASSASAYSPNAATQAAELAACMRYYEVNSFASGTEGMAIGFVQNSTTARYAFAVVPKRTTPTVAYTGTLHVEINGGSTIAATGLANTKYGGASLCSFYLTVASGLTGGQACCLYASGSTVTISFDSEL